MKKFLGATAVGFLTILTGPSMADDASERSGFRQRSILEAGRTVQGDYAAVGRTVRISGTVTGDVYAAGWRILIDGDIQGDLIAAGAKVIVTGTVRQDMRILAAHAVLSGTVGRNVGIAATDVQFTEPSVVAGSLMAATGEAELLGRIGGAARLGARGVSISNRIEGDVAVAGGHVVVASGAFIGGRLKYWGDRPPAINEGSTVRGQVVQRPWPMAWKEDDMRRGLSGIRIGLTAASLFSTWLVGYVLLRLYPAFARRVASTIMTRPGRSLGWGVAALLAGPVIVAALLVSLIGMPAGVILLSLYLVTVYLSRIYALTCAGWLLYRRADTPSALRWNFAIGLMLYGVLSLIPIVGDVITLAAILLGLGALLATKKDLVEELRARNQL